VIAVLLTIAAVMLLGLIALGAWVASELWAEEQAHLRVERAHDDATAWAHEQRYRATQASLDHDQAVRAKATEIRARARRAMGR
jgi:hypothetical protein